MDISPKLSVVICVYNEEANIAPLYEQIQMALKGIDSEVMVYITISTGIGGGLIFNEKVFHGSNDGAGEVGHMIIEPAGPKCGFGQHRGCLEAMASGTAITRNVKAELKNNPDKYLEKYKGKIKDINGADIAKAAQAGDKLAQKVYQEAGKYLGIGVANLINLFNPDTIVFGGGVMKAKELFWIEMLKSVENNALSASANDCEFLEAALGDNTGVIGAIAVAIKG
ncbi:MAG: ROK family protein [Halanaerobium sp.]